MEPANSSSASWAGVFPFGPHALACLRVETLSMVRAALVNFGALAAKCLLAF